MFDAFIELGGSADEPAAFDWRTNGDALQTRAQHNLLVVFQGRTSNHGAARLRARVRLDGALNTKFAWNLWQRYTLSPSDTERNATVSISKADRSQLHAQPGCGYVPQEEDLRQQQLTDVWVALKAGLSSADYHYLYEVYHEGKRHVDLAREVVRQRARQYVHPHDKAEALEMARAIDAVHVAVHRARCRAARVLRAPKWRELLGTC